MTPDEKSVRDLIARWHRAAAIGDVATILNLIAEDAVFLMPGMPPLRGRKAFEAGFRRSLLTHRIDSTGHVQEVLVSGGLAYAWTALKVNTTPRAGGETISRSGSALSIFSRQEDGSWVLVRDANLLPSA